MGDGGWVMEDGGWVSSSGDVHHDDTSQQEEKLFLLLNRCWSDVGQMLVRCWSDVGRNTEMRPVFTWTKLNIRELLSETFILCLTFSHRLIKNLHSSYSVCGLNRLNGFCCFTCEGRPHVSLHMWRCCEQQSVDINVEVLSLNSEQTEAAQRKPPSCSSVQRCFVASELIE